MPGSTRRKNDGAGVTAPELTEEEIAKGGPDRREAMRIRRARHRVGDAELLPKSKFSPGGRTSEGDFSDMDD